MELFFRKYGEGRPVIIVHGLFGMCDNWATFSKKLAGNNFTVFTPDLRNHGNSPHSEIFNYKALSDDINEFIIQNNIIKPLLIGHSLGGKIIMNFVLRYPDVAEKIIIIDMGIRKYKIHNDDILNAMLNCDITSKGSRQEIEEVLSESIGQKKVVQLMMKNVQRKNDGTFSWKPDLISIKNNFSEIFKAVNCKRKSDIPALFVGADKSEYISMSDMVYIREIFPLAGFVCVPGSTHWVHSDKPEELLCIVEAFIRKQ